MIHKPIIGLTMEYDNKGEYFSKLPWFAMRENYFIATVEAGGVPIAFPYAHEVIDVYLDLIDALIITGGKFDIDPALYGEKLTGKGVNIIHERTQFEIKLLEEALKRDMPVFGICGGQQLMNVFFGGTLYQHLPDEYPSDIAHEQPTPRTEAGHEVIIQPRTQLSHYVNHREKIPVNSAHHQAVKKLGKDLIINAKATDGLIEGFEHPHYRFCIGLQWHPEFFISEGDEAIFQHFIKAASDFHHAKKTAYPSRKISC